MSDTPAGVGHNKGPVTPPFETDLLADLKTRYPDVEPKLVEIETEAANIPAEIVDDTVAGQVQEWLRTAADAQRRWKANRGIEKSPWQNLADTAFNYFKNPEDKVTALVKEHKPKHTRYLEVKAEIEERRLAEKAAAERRETERLQKLAAEAEERRVAAIRDAEEAEARRIEEDRKAEEARWDRIWAEARAELAAIDERLAEKRRQELEDRQRQQRRADKKQLTTLTKEANKLAEKDKDGTLTDDERARYRELIGTNGEIPMLQGRLDGDGSALLTDEERAELAVEEANLVRLRRERVDNQTAAEAAKAKLRAAQTAGRAAKKDEAEASADAKDAHQQAAQVGKQAEKSDARAGRLERQVENSSDADLSRTRSERGTVGSLSGRWAPVVEDRDALTAYFGPLGMFLMPDAQDAAVYRYMRQHQGTFTETPTRTDVPGVFFENVPESRIR